MDVNGNLVISLDFELLWGVFDVVDYKKKNDYFEKTREVIPGILDLFLEYEVHATWAIVGMLFNRNWEEWKKNIPANLPAYKKSELSAYEFGQKNFAEIPETNVFAPDLIKAIGRVKGQEVATHTYSHYYCLEEGQGISGFKADLEKAIKMGHEAGFDIKSLVFPRNQIKEDYLKICYELGIENIRTNPTSWYWKDTLSEALLNKVARSGDAYFPLGKKSYKPDNNIKEFPIEHKASRFLRPVEDNKLLRELKLRRIEQEIEMAAKQKEIYHLWWHPHNFGDKPEESLKDLRRILTKFTVHRVKDNFQSINMREAGKKLALAKKVEKH